MKNPFKKDAKEKKPRIKKQVKPEPQAETISESIFSDTPEIKEEGLQEVIHPVEIKEEPNFKEVIPQQDEQKKQEEDWRIAHDRAREEWIRKYP